jgi:predicted MPP superfamily phosphohydrolase
VLIEPGWVVTRETRLPIARWPAALGPLRIVAIADLHTGAPHITLEKVADVVARVNAARPDLVVLLGDYVIHGVGISSSPSGPPPCCAAWQPPSASSRSWATTTGGTTATA